jgi:hypothetical protein
LARTRRSRAALTFLTMTIKPNFHATTEVDFNPDECGKAAVSMAR